MKNLLKMGLIAYSVIGLLSIQTATASHYEVTSLVSDLASLAPHTDPHLINPWGLFFTPNGHLWVSDNGSNFATAYSLNGKVSSHEIQAAGGPTGAKYNPSPYTFLLAIGQPARYLFSTEAGTILGFNSVENKMVVAADKSASGSVYKGLEMGVSCCQQSFLYATDFHNGKVDIFNKSFQIVGSCKSAAIPSGYAPFNVKMINDLLYVTYAKQQGPQNHDDEPGTGHGFIDLFNIWGTFMRRLISGGHLNSPWGLALAPANFGEFSNTLLVGNFGDGKIHSYDPSTGKFLGHLADANNLPIAIEGLWSLEFDSKGILYFTAGPGQESAGLIGTISLLP
jgi:uncharacterized protein (TIGR03118 family)